eukprot:97293-Pelagomonas_calceolata.AAC.1
MKTYHAHFGTPLGSIPGLWDERKQDKKPLLPIYLRQDHHMIQGVTRGKKASVKILPINTTQYFMLTPFRSKPLRENQRLG